MIKVSGEAFFNIRLDLSSGRFDSDTCNVGVNWGIDTMGSSSGFDCGVDAVVRPLGMDWKVGVSLNAGIGMATSSVGTVVGVWVDVTVPVIIDAEFDGDMDL